MNSPLEGGSRFGEPKTSHAPSRVEISVWRRTIWLHSEKSLRFAARFFDHPSRGRFDSGFTLVELLVSLTLLGMLSLVLLGGLHFGRSVWEASETKTAAVDRIRAFQTVFKSELERAYPELGEVNATEGAKG